MGITSPAPAGPNLSGARGLTLERNMVLIRWGGVAFGLLQVFTFYRPYPEGILAFALCLVALLAVGNCVIALTLSRIRTGRGERALSVAGLVLDGTVVLGLVFAYTFDPETAIWALIYILPLEASMRFGWKGGMWSMTAATLAYTAREIFGHLVYGNDLLATSISFRMGIGFIIAAVSGSTSSTLARVAEQVQEANLRLREAGELSSHLLAVTNHELRNPLTTIRGFAGMLTRSWSSLSDDDKQSYVEIIDSQSKRLTLLVEDLLTLSAADAGGLSLDVNEVDLRPVIDGALHGRSFEKEAVEVDCSPLLRVVADPRRTEQIVMNLVTNAFKYGASPVKVEASEGDGWVDVHVIDRGPGVPDHFVPQLFDRFTQATRGEPGSGSGLGLAIARELARAQGGDVYYEPRHPAGSCFRLRLPNARLAATTG